MVFILDCNSEIRAHCKFSFTRAQHIWKMKSNLESILCVRRWHQIFNLNSRTRLILNSSVFISMH